MARTLYRPRVKSFWVLVRRLLYCRRKSYRPGYAAAAEEDGEKSRLLISSRSSLEELLASDDADGDGGIDAAVCRSASPCSKPVAAVVRPTPGLHPPVVARQDGLTGGDPDGAAVQCRRRFMFSGFRRRLLMRRPWRPVLVAIPE
ncbi:uncharacterized protein LOC102716448 [Oryza brachyantha]|uniref:Uncharacterized protein n=1 Tax=Oryza brachyantha TaxID=4533 RepID=J3KW70_ORYBR|nr:uncharacterized protein LOC102716448 [Oryza brachyantha]